MKTINFDEYEIGLLVRYLENYRDYIIKKPIKDGFDDRAYDIEKIGILLSRLRKNNYRPNYEQQKGSYKENILDISESELKRKGYINEQT